MSFFPHQVVPAVSRLIWQFNLNSHPCLENSSVFLGTKYVHASESSHLLLRHLHSLKLSILLLTGVFLCILAAGLRLTETLHCIEQLQPQQPSQPCFSSQDQEPLAGELWPRELGLMNCFSIQIWHYSSLLSPSLAPVHTFTTLTLLIPHPKVNWESGREEGRSWLSAALPHPPFPRFDSSEWAKLGCW